MATTNLSYQSLGLVNFESGNGIPDHSGTAGDMYLNIDSGMWYECNGNAVWTPLAVDVAGVISTSGNTGTVGIAASATWYRTCNIYSWTENIGKGLYMDNNHLVVWEPGLYRVSISGNLYYTSTTAGGTYKAALIKNDTYTELISAQTAVYYNYVLWNGSFCAGAMLQLAKDDRLELVIRNLSTTTDVILQNASIVALKTMD